MVEYFFWKMADYFTNHLMGDKTERMVDIEEMNKEIEQSGTKGGGVPPARRGEPEGD